MRNLQVLRVLQNRCGRIGLPAWFSFQEMRALERAAWYMSFALRKYLRGTKLCGLCASPIKSCANHSIHCVVGYCTILGYHLTSLPKSADKLLIQSWMTCSARYRTL